MLLQAILNHLSVATQVVFYKTLVTSGLATDIILLIFMYKKFKKNTK